MSRVNHGPKRVGYYFMHGNKEMIDINLYIPLTEDTPEFKYISDFAHWYHNFLLYSLLDINKPTINYNLKGAKQD